MDLSRLNRREEYEWEIPVHGNMRVPGIIYASEELIRAMDDKVFEQTANVAMLPGIVAASYAMPDATGRNNPICLGVERSDTADRKPVTPVCIRHRI